MRNDVKHSIENETKQNTKSLKYVLYGREKIPWQA